MIKAPTPQNEEARLHALYKLGLLNSVSDERFDQITRAAQQALQVPIAVVSLLDRERQVFKAARGLDTPQTPRDISFCGHAICDNTQGLMVVEDAQADERFHDNPLVTGEPHIRFYAGRVIHGPDGHALGTLCVLDREPRQLSAAEAGKMHALADQIEQMLRMEQTPGTQPEPQLKQANATADSTRSEAFFKWPSRRGAAATIALLIFMAFLWTAYQWHLRQLQSEREELVRQAEVFAANLRGKMETELNARLYLTKGLAGLVHSDQEFTDAQFQTFAQSLGDQRTGIRSLQLAPQGVVQHVWPLATNQAAIGHDLFGDPRRREAAEDAIKARRIWLAGPLNLIQGGTALIGRLPIFLYEGQADKERFWGFGTVLIDLNHFFEQVGLNADGQDAQIAIRGKDAKGGLGAPFYGDASIINKRLTSTEVSLPAGSWEISIGTPENTLKGWPGQEVFWASVVVLGLFFSISSYLLLRLPAKLRQTVERTTEALQQQQILFRDAVEALPDGFVIFDAKDRLVTHNERFKSLFSSSGEAIAVGERYEDILRYGCRQGQFKRFNPDVEPIEQFVQRRMDFHRSGFLTLEEPLDSGKWVRVVERPIRGGGTVCFAVDITELKYNEKELSLSRDRAEAANLAKSNFLATVSHEVRTPMNVILGLLETVTEGDTLPEKTHKLLSTAHQSATQLLHILNEILDISKMESNKLALDQAPFNPLDTVNNVVELTRPIAAEKGIVLETDIQPTATEEFIGDSMRLQQILFNLLSNAVKFTEQGKIVLRASYHALNDDEALWEFAVTDSGIGFDPEQAENLFQPFSQLDSGAKRSHEGTGLGLAICKRLVELMGGSIAAESAAGEGATFRFSLPLARAPQKKISHPPLNGGSPQRQQTTTRKLKILLAEDSPANQLVFSAMLESAGHALVMVSDGEAAVRACEEQDFDIILMDIFMPGMDGVTATVHIRENARMRHTPIIAMTANAMKGDQERYLEAGMDDYLSKPVNKAQLLRKLGEWSGAETTAPVRAQP